MNGINRHDENFNNDGYMEDLQYYHTVFTRLSIYWSVRPTNRKAPNLGPDPSLDSRSLFPKTNERTNERTQSVTQSASPSPLSCFFLHLSHNILTHNTGKKSESNYPYHMKQNKRKTHDKQNTDTYQANNPHCLMHPILSYPIPSHRDPSTIPRIKHNSQKVLPYTSA